MMDHPGNPLHEGAGTAAKGMAELMAALIMLAQIYRQSQEAIRASRIHTEIEQANARTREEAHRARLADRAAAHRKSQWQLALDKGWMRTASASEVLQVWTAAVPSAYDAEQGDVRATRAMRLAEERLEQLDPELVRRYRKILSDLGEAPEHIFDAMQQARTPPPPDAATVQDRHDPVAVAGELGPVPEAWEAGPPVAGALPRGEMIELDPAPAWPMGAAGWSDAERESRVSAAAAGDSEGESLRSLLAAAAAGAIDPDAPQEQLGGMSARERLAAMASGVRAEEQRSLFASPAEIDRGVREVRPIGSPIAGPGNGGPTAGGDGPVLGRSR